MPRTPTGFRCRSCLWSVRPERPDRRRGRATRIGRRAGRDSAGALRPLRRAGRRQGAPGPLSLPQVHGGKIVFFLRFIALVGPFGGVLAGANRMAIGRFMIFNALGAVAWNLVFGAGGYLFGAMFEAVGRTAGVAAVIVTRGA